MPKYSKTHHEFSDRSQTKTVNVKALLVGINYRGTRNQLGGCINDALNTKKRILSEYPSAQIELLTDDTPNKPTRSNILDNLKKLVNNCKPGDTLMFHYSGHGSQVQDIHGDAEDGLDETICPIDFMLPRTIKYRGKTYKVDSQILNNEIHGIISAVPKGVKFLMLSDSCHSGTIGDLKNDFHHYHGPNEWGDSSSESSHNSHGYPVAQVPSPQHSESSSSSTNKLFSCNTHWTYARHSMELWVTPLIWDLYKTFGNFKIKIDKYTKLPQELIINGIYKCSTTFEQISANEFKITATELSANNFIAVPSVATYNKERALAENSGTVDMFNIVADIKYNYDSITGRHIHTGAGKKRSLNMKSICSHHGGELRVISGCEESETSADTGTNGACTKAFWDTVQGFGGLITFFPKLFSHNVQELKDIQDTINLNLHRFGFTQHSVISWEHAHNLPVSSADQVVEVSSSQPSYLYRPYEKQKSHSRLPKGPGL